MNSINKFLKIVRGYTRRVEMSPSIEIDSQGFSLRLEDKIVDHLGWENVEKVEVYKRDLLTIDLICISFHCLDGSVFEVNEDLAGFSELIDAIKQNLPGSQSDWKSEVSQPAFATNAKVIFCR